MPAVANTHECVGGVLANNYLITFHPFHCL